MASREATLRAVAGLSFAAACIHASVLAAHAFEYWLFGVFFFVASALQLGWAALVWQGREDAWLLTSGVVGNAAIVAVWLVSRTVGLPFGPLEGEAESAGIKDVVATYDEILLVLLTWTAMGEGRPRLPAWSLTAAWWLAAVGLVAALLDAAH